MTPGAITGRIFSAQSHRRASMRCLHRSRGRHRIYRGKSASRGVWRPHVRGVGRCVKLANDGRTSLRDFGVFVSVLGVYCWRLRRLGWL